MRDGTDCTGITSRRMRAAMLALAMSGLLLAPATRAGETSSQAMDGIAPHIAAVMNDAEVIREIRRWGLSRADVQHDIDAMSVADRARLAYLLARSWPRNETYGRAALQAQFLVTLSLLRESTLFASIVSRNPAVLR